MKGQDRLYVVTISDALINPTHSGDVNEDCVVNPRVIQIYSELFFSRDCVVEAG